MDVTVSRSVVLIGWLGSLTVGMVCVFFGISSWRTRDQAQMQLLAAWFMFAAAAWVWATPLAPWLRKHPLISAVRLAFLSSAFVWRGLAFIVVGSNKLDRTSELLGAGIAVTFAVVLVVMRLLYDSAMAAAIHARD